MLFLVCVIILHLASEFTQFIIFFAKIGVQPKTPQKTQARHTPYPPSFLLSLPNSYNLQMTLKRQLLYIDGKDVSRQVAHFVYEGNQCRVVFKNQSKAFYYSKNRARIVKTGLSKDKAFEVFRYLKDIAHTVGLKTEEGHNILARSYDRITEVSKDSILTSYLEGKGPTQIKPPQTPIGFPFGFNLSQKKAVEAAFTNRLSVIEGPPGTGKTQTILNIIAHAVANNLSVAVVSSNNSATLNVYEKLQKQGVEFIAAVLGNTENKKEFIASQKEIPDLSNHRISFAESQRLSQKLRKLDWELSTQLEIKNELALISSQLDQIKTEFEHFKRSHLELTYHLPVFKNAVSSDLILSLWIALENRLKKKKKWNLFSKLFYQFKYRIKESDFFVNPVNEMLLVCMYAFYTKRIQELTERIRELTEVLKSDSFDSQMKTCTQIARKLFKGTLVNRYAKKLRKKYTVEGLRDHANEFIQDYPVVMSTTYSLRASLSDSILYDMVIIDESSQVDLATGALALSCAKSAVIVGDTKQLPNVVSGSIQLKTQSVFDQYNLNRAYDYANNSILTSILSLFPDVAKTLLREHYRCHPKIIEFCNQMFYNNELIVHSSLKSKREPLIVYKTSQGNHARGRFNQRQIDIIRDEIIPKHQLHEVDLGIVTPYRHQTQALQNTFEGTHLMADTVDKFQGRENQVIILSTVDNQITDFTDNPNRLNVAVSRAIEQLIVVVHGNELRQNTYISDLIRYIEYHNYAVVESDLYSIFDLLYKGYENQRRKQLRKSQKVSDFDSENLMYGVIREVLSQEEFTHYDVLIHYPLKDLIRDHSKLGARELQYATNPLTHLDFIIYNKLGKNPVLVVEVDGYAYHQEGSRQASRDQLKDAILEKYGIPILRLKTNESNEKARLIAKLKRVQNEMGQSVS